MKAVLFTLFLSATMLALPNLYAQGNSAHNASISQLPNSKIDTDKISFYEFVDTLQGIYYEDDSRFNFYISWDNEIPEISIYGDSKIGAIAKLLDYKASISKEELAKILPKLRAKSKINKYNCKGYPKVKGCESINASDFDYFYLNYLGFLYSQKNIKNISAYENIDTLPKKLSFVISFRSIIKNSGEKSNFLVDEGKKIYEEIKDKNLVPDFILLKFVANLRAYLNNEEDKTYFTSEAKKLFTAFCKKNKFNFFDETFYAYLIEEDKEIKAQLKNYINIGIKNSTAFAFKNLSFSAVEASQIKKLSEDDILFIIKTLSEFKKSPEGRPFEEDLKIVKVEFSLLLKKPDYKLLKKELNSVKDAGTLNLSRNKSMKMAYIYEKLGGSNNIKKVKEFVKAAKDLQSVYKLEYPSPLILDGIFSEDYARFIIENFGKSNYKDFINNHPEAKKIFDKSAEFNDLKVIND